MAAQQCVLAAAVCYPASQGGMPLRAPALALEIETSPDPITEQLMGSLAKDRAATETNLKTRQAQRALAAARDAYHLRLKQKYDCAARYPWLPVEPDPPEPE